MSLKMHMIATVAIIVAGGLWTRCACGFNIRDEVQMSDQEWQKLDVFESKELSKANKVFAAGEFRRATAEYDSFLLEFPRSSAIPFAILRKARSLQLDGKRYKAIKQYQEVLDYFPNAVKYAGAALYYIGQCHWENGKIEDAMKAWARMAEDKGYSKQPLAADAINRLADNLVKQGKAAQAAKYYVQVATDFRGSNREAAWYAVQQAVKFYVRTSPAEPKLRELYVAVGGLDQRPRKVDDDPLKDKPYWTELREAVFAYGTFSKDEAELQDRYWRYWASVLDGKFPAWDDFQIDLARMKLGYEKDSAAYFKRLDEQFSKYQKPADYGRIVKWVGLYGEHKDRWMTYYGKLDFARMSNAEMLTLLKTLYEVNHEPEMAANVFGKLHMDKMSDREKYQLARYLWSRDAKLVRATCLAYKDKGAGQMELLEFYRWKRNSKDGVELADKVAKDPRYASKAYFYKGELLQTARQYEQAIIAFRKADNPPKNLWEIANCYVAMGKPSQGIAQLREVENFFENYAPEAALRVAHVYRDTKDKARYVAELRNVLKKYPKSRQSSQAHQELEKLGVKIGGAVDAE